MVSRKKQELSRQIFLGGYVLRKFKLFLTTNWKRVIAFVLVFTLMVCSVTVLAKKFTDPATYRNTIESIDEKKVAVLGVSAAIAGSATVLASVSGDATTPLAEEMMDLSGYLIAVVFALVLEKSLLTVFGAVACYLLIPIACMLALVFIVNKKGVLFSWTLKLLALAVALLVVVPISMRLSDYIYEINQVSFEQDAEEIVAEDDVKQDIDNQPWYKKLWNAVTNAVESTVETVVEKGKQVLNEFIDAVSVFVIAYCVIPIVTVFLFLWLLKVLFGLNIKVKPETFSIKRIKKMKKAQSQSVE